MKYRKLGKTGLEVSVIGVGTDQFSGGWGKMFSQNEVNNILCKARELGINFLDTAECYGSHLSETMIGNAINKNRDEWIIATKFGHKYEKFNNRISDFSPKGVMKQLNDSLKSLNTDYVDIYQFHSGNYTELNQNELWDILNEQVKAGRIKHLGISLVNSAVISDDLSQIEYAKKIGIEIIQIVYNRLYKKAMEKVIPYCTKHNFGIIGRAPLAKGFLSGKYAPGFVFPENDKRSSENKTQTLNQLKLVQEIKKNEALNGIDMTQWALAWCLKNPAITTIIPGCKNIKQIKQNAKSVELI